MINKIHRGRIIFMVMQEPCWLNHKLVVLIFTNTCIVQLSIKDDQVCFFR